jgi:O-antigen/teichoic acid export membrane protein/O-antigen ligase
MSARAVSPRLPGARRVGRGEATLALGAAAFAALATVALGPKALAIPFVVLIVAFFMREPLALLNLYLVVGLFKEESVVKSLPVDATLALGMLVALACAIRLVTGRVRQIPFGFALTITVVSLALITSLAWTGAGGYGTTKTTTFLTVTMLAIGAPFFLIEGWDDVRRFFTWTVIVAVPVAILALANPSTDTGRLAGDNTIGTSRLLCTGALILLLGALARPRLRLPSTALAAAFIAIAAAVGSRGPILSLGLALAVTLVAWLLRVPRKVAPVLAIAALSLAVVPFVSLPKSSSERLSSAARDPVAAFRSDDRYFLVQQAWGIIKQDPIRGGGVGEFSVVNPSAKWPHNFFLEVWAELGLAALIAVAAAIVIALVGLFRLGWRLPEHGRDRELVYVLLAVFFFNLLAVQVSGNINDNRDFWGILAIAWMVIAGGVAAGVAGPQEAAEGARRSPAVPLGPSWPRVRGPRTPRRARRPLPRPGGRRRAEASLLRRAPTVERPAAAERPPPATELPPGAETDHGIAEFAPPSIAAGGFETVLFKAGELVSQVLMVVLTGRLLGPSGRGIYALASLSVGICQVPFGSVWVANAVELARKRATPRQLAGVSVVVAAGGGLITAAVAIAISPAFGDKWWVLAFPALITPFVLLRAYQEGIWQALGHVRAVNVLRLGRASLPFLFILPPLLADASVRTTIIIWELAFVVLAVTAWFRLRAFIGPVDFPRDRAIYKRVTRYGLTISGFRIVEVLNERNGLIALAIFASDATVGVFSIAVAATEVLLLATEALALSTFKRISSDSREASAALSVRTMRHCVILAAAASVVVIPFVWVAIPFVLGHGYGDVPLLLVLLAPNVLCLAAVRPLYSFFQVQTEKPASMFRVVAAALVTNTALNIALVPLWHARGAAIAASLSGMVAVTVAFRVFAAEANVRLSDLRPQREDLMAYVHLATSVLGRLRRA